MKIRNLFMIYLVGCLLLSGCHKIPSSSETGSGENTNNQGNGSISTSDWGRGESPVPNRRMGLDRNFPEHIANGENGIYLLDRSFVS